MKDNKINKLKTEHEVEKRPGRSFDSGNMNHPELQEIIDGIIKAQELKQQLAKELSREAKGQGDSLKPSVIKARIKQSHVERLEAGRANNASKGKNGRGL